MKIKPGEYYSDDCTNEEDFAFVLKVEKSKQIWWVDYRILYWDGSVEYLQTKSAPSFVLRFPKKVKHKYFNTVADKRIGKLVEDVNSFSAKNNKYITWIKEMAKTT